MIKKTNKLNDVLKQLNGQTVTCKTCFKESRGYSFREFLTNTHECNACFASKVPKFEKFKVDDVKCLSIYPYDDTMKSLIYQLKGCGDFELAPTFLESYAWLLRLIYFKHFIVYVPSYFKDDEERGFNHVEQIFSCLKLPYIKLFEKSEHHKQSDQLYKDRNQIKKYIKLINNEDLHGKRILLVDDIYTTGNTIKTCVDLIKTLHPKSIEVLVLCKTYIHPKK